MRATGAGPAGEGRALLFGAIGGTETLESPALGHVGEAEQGAQHQRCRAGLKYSHKSGTPSAPRAGRALLARAPICASGEFRLRHANTGATPVVCPFIAHTEGEDNRGGKLRC